MVNATPRRCWKYDLAQDHCEFAVDATAINDLDEVTVCRAPSSERREALLVGGNFLAFPWDMLRGVD